MLVSYAQLCGASKTGQKALDRLFGFTKRLQIAKWNLIFSDRICGSSMHLRKKHWNFFPSINWHCLFKHQKCVAYSWTFLSWILNCVLLIKKSWVRLNKALMDVHCSKKQSKNSEAWRSFSSKRFLSCFSPQKMPCKLVWCCTLATTEKLQPTINVISPQLHRLLLVWKRTCKKNTFSYFRDCFCLRICQKFTHFAKGGRDQSVYELMVLEAAKDIRIFTEDLTIFKKLLSSFLIFHVCKHTFEALQLSGTFPWYLPQWTFSYSSL